MTLTDQNFNQFRIFFIVVIALCCLAPILEYFRIPGGWLIAGAWFGWSAWKGLEKAAAIGRVQREYEIGQMDASYQPKYRLKDLELLGFDYDGIRSGIEDEALETLADLEAKYHDVIEEKNLEGDEFMFVTNTGDKGYKQ